MGESGEHALREKLMEAHPRVKALLAQVRAAAADEAGFHAACEAVRAQDPEHGVWALLQFAREDASRDQRIAILRRLPTFEVDAADWFLAGDHGLGSQEPLVRRAAALAVLETRATSRRRLGYPLRMAANREKDPAVKAEMERVFEALRREFEAK